MLSGSRGRPAAAIIVLAAAFAYAYGRTLAALVRQWTLDADSSYGIIIAAVAAVLAWNRRHQFAAAARADASPVPGAIFLFSAVAVYLVGQLSAEIYLTRISFVIALAGTLALVAGLDAARALSTPLAFLAIAMPLPALVVNAVTFPLQLAASQIAESTLRVCSVPVLRDGNLLTIRSGTLEVAQACSGLRSLVSLTALAIAAAWLMESRWWRRVLVVAAAVPVAIVMNGLRVAATGMASDTWGRAATSGGWHEFTGWVTFVVSMVALAAVYRLLENRRSASIAGAEQVA